MRHDLHIRIPTKPESPRTIPESTPLQLISEAAFSRLHRSNYYNFFLILSFLISLGESILVGFGADGVAFDLQIAFLAAASTLFLLVLLTEVRYLVAEDDIGEVKRPLLVFSLFGPDVVFEASCLAFGWATLFVRPGLAALRCLRLFRFFSYSHLYGGGETLINMDVRQLFGLRQAISWAIVYLERIGRELFSGNSLGGLVIVAIFFFISYLFAVIFWVEKSDLLIDGSKYGNDCTTLNNCFITILRLGFLDTNGFDYLQGIMNSGARGYAFLLLLYVVVAALILLNGLVGVFSRVFVPTKGASANNTTVLTRGVSQKINTDRASLQLRPITPSNNGGTPRMSNGHPAPPGSNQSVASDQTDTAELASTIELLRLEIASLNGKVSHIHEMLRSRLVVGPVGSPSSSLSTTIVAPESRPVGVSAQEQRDRQKVAALERTIDRAALMAKKLSSTSAFTFSGPDADEDEHKDQSPHHGRVEIPSTITEEDDSVPIANE